ncbi:DUF2752 domain-containing protein [Pedobacter sp. HDW13]|uniref:DUF2752 domain-containing protein n=1 Tax=unclassified Pedobacter TaxID=2628915 RepID=UPI000F591EDF|nr:MULTISPECIES: DUF2752 domain-containing protein [unclassified Pedobacter]QIL39690.1 DUF2752 domain-containing protein [Pedobacter sp. HDW13]RQO79830.1 hypothetical protein DBR40_02415 [Pedobacter sp. KBW01]
MFILFIFCSLINLVDWLQNHLISCPFKALTGIDCPGCGFQRSFIAIIQGDLSKSWLLYPPTIPLLILFIAAGLLYKFPIKNQSLILRILVIVVGNFVMLSYLYKMLLH